MTIAKKKHRRPNRATRKRSGKHHQKKSRYIKAYWPYLPIIAIISFGFLLNTWVGTLHRNVLSYATDITSAGLLSATNGQRAVNGLGGLTQNSTLNQAAQAKAADMAANNYWAHTSPSGKTPWTFIDATGYSYESAGENLAYGFATSSETVTGWMNSPGHRTNILNTKYTEVGFGIINIENYQDNGNQTVVVAMYALPTGRIASTPVTPPSATAPKTNEATTTTAPATTSAGGTSAETGTDGTPAVTQKNDTVQPAASTTAGESAPAESTKSTPVKRIELVTSANVAWVQFALSMIVSVAVLIFLLRHSLAWHRVLVRGERFIIHHPVLDVGIVAVATLGAILLQTSGVIK